VQFCKKNIIIVTEKWT